MTVKRIVLDVRDFDIDAEDEKDILIITQDFITGVLTEKSGKKSNGYVASMHDHDVSEVICQICNELSRDRVY